MKTTGSSEALAPARVLLVTAPDCHFCADAKALLARLGQTYPLEVREVDLSSPEGQETATRHGIMFPPGLLLDGGFVGFGRVSERKLRRLLAQRADTGAARGEHGEHGGQEA
jgi:glutaredoxin